jgi:hypothetical protein
MKLTQGVKLNHLRPIQDWYEFHKEQGGKVFPTFASLQWFVRQHRDSLVDAEVLIPGKGSRRTLVTAEFGPKVYEILFK